MIYGKMELKTWLLFQKNHVHSQSREQFLIEDGSMVKKQTSQNSKTYLRIGFLY